MNPTDGPDCATYVYFGVGNGNQCICGNTVSPLAGVADAANCASPCPGDPDQTCGDAAHVEVYRTPAPVVPTPQAIGRSLSVYQGCYTETGQYSRRRTLYGPSNSGTQMDHARCARVCQHYLYWGVEYGSECYCANSITPGARRVYHDECDMPCSGEPSELCGGSHRIAVYRRLNREIKEPSWMG